MAKLVKSVSIRAPVDQVFAYISQPVNQVEIWPSMIEVSNVEHLPDGGYTHDWLYKMAGVRLNGSTKTTEFIPNQRFVEQTKGGLESVLTWTFEPEDGGTRLTVVTEYKVPIPVLGRMAEALIVKMNDQESSFDGWWKLISKWGRIGGHRMERWPSNAPGADSAPSQRNGIPEALELSI